MWLLPALRAMLSGSPSATTRPPFGAAFGPEIDDPIGLRHDIQIVLDDDHGVSRIDQTLQHLHQLLDVRHVQPDGRLVEHIQGVLSFAARDVDADRVGARLGELGDELDALALAARERRARLAETQVARGPRRRGAARGCCMAR